MEDSRTPRLQKQLKNKRFFKSLFWQLLVLLGVAASHALLTSLFIQKYGTHRQYHSSSKALRTILTIRLLAETQSPQKITDRGVAALPPVISLPILNSSPDLELENSVSLPSQETPERAAFNPTDQLTEEPVVQVDIDPKIATSLANNVSRIAILRLLIDEFGEIDQVLIEKSDFYESEIELLIAACKAMKFAPGKIGKTPVKSDILIELTIPPINVNQPAH